MAQRIILQLVLILINAFFAATEIAVISLNEKKVKARAEDGDKKAIKMLKMTEDSTRFLSTIQIGITLAGFLGSAFAADNFAELLSQYLITSFEALENYASLINDASVVIITLVLSFFTLVLGELVPKRIAMRHSEKLAEHVCGLISFIAALLRPIIWLLTVSTNCVLRIFGIDPNEKEETVSEEDIVLMLDAGADEGTLNQDDIEYIKNVFKLDRMTAEEVMTPRKSVSSICLDATEEEILEIIVSDGYSRIPVFDLDNDKVVGILHVRDFLLKRGGDDFSVENLMMPPVFVPESVHLDVLFKDMQTDHNHMAIVINEYGDASGIVTLEDIIEELVGEIWDERDEEVSEYTQLTETTYQVLCNTLVENFCEYFSVELAEEIEATTLNGLLTEMGGAIPAEGNVFEYENLVITVTKADDLMAHEVVVEVKPVLDENGEPIELSEEK